MCIKVIGRSISQFLKYIIKVYVTEGSRPRRIAQKLDEKLLFKYESCGRAWKLIGRLDEIKLDPHLVKYRIQSLLTKGSDEQSRRLGFHNHNDEVTHVNDDTSIHRVLKTINYNSSFPIED